jgi:hypothetical protein
MAVYKACLTLLANSTSLFGHGSFKRAVRSLDLPDSIQISWDDVLKLEVQLENEVRASAIVRNDRQLNQALEKLNTPVMRIDSKYSSRLLAFSHTMNVL